ncbi:MAG TPA: ABC transporter ATP-binding protein [Candidatus Methylomirabilis sp.]|nr:ABC transporter ATP-binding protein [Candidatus Methylomirabilis sp.]
MAEAALLEVRDAWKHYGRFPAVAGVSLRLPPGEVRALIGPNGAGKTTLLNLVTGQVPCDRGDILFRGQRINGLPPHRICRRGISRTFQITATFGTLTALENVQVALLASRGWNRDLLSRAAPLLTEEALDLLNHVGLGNQADKPGGTLALGDLKRLELAIALANRPELLLLDEPTAGMAPHERMELIALVVGIVRDRGLTVLFTEHDMDVVFAAAERILVLHQGKVLAEGSPQAVRDNPEVQEIYLGG